MILLALSFSLSPLHFTLSNPCCLKVLFGFLFLVIQTPIRNCIFQTSPFFQSPLHHFLSVSHPFKTELFLQIHLSFAATFHKSPPANDNVWSFTIFEPDGNHNVVKNLPLVQLLHPAPPLVLRSCGLPILANICSMSNPQTYSPTLRIVPC